MTALDNEHPALRRCWHPVARNSEIGRDPVHIRLLGEDWVLVRLGGRLAAFVDRCPHRLAPLSAGSVDGEVLRCGYHGWCFDATGACTSIPSLGTEKIPPRAGVATPAGVTESQGLVFLAPEPPVNEVLVVPEADDPSFLHGVLEPFSASAGAGLLADNFLDMTHFPFLHAATIGTEDEVDFEVDVERNGYGLTIHSRHLFPNHEDPGVRRGERPLLQHRRLRYEYRAPFSVSLRIDYEEAGGTNVIDFHVQPVDTHTCRIYTAIHRDDLDGDEQHLAECIAFERKIIDEDLRLQERYVDRRLPLDLPTEVHVRADKPTVELRRVLKELVDAH